MEATDTGVTIQCSRLLGMFMLFLGVPFMALVALLLGAITLTTPFMSAKLGAQNLATIYLLFPAIVAGFAWVVWVVIRHRETLFTTFRVSRTGIVIENSRYGVLALDWNELSGATYSRFGKMITLQSSKLAKPLSIMNLGQRGLSPEFVTARRIIQGAMRDGWKERLL